MIVALAITVAFGALIANPSFSLVGAAGLVGGTILFALSATWTVRKSWEPADRPDLSVSEEVAQRRIRRITTIECTFAPLLIGGGVWRMATGDIGGIFNVLIGSLILSMAVTTFRSAEKARREESAPEDPST
jgi:hypothetical protein